jgi:7,8-dihydro-6-hydroxymethylpterin-pyrophosphokinase
MQNRSEGFTPMPVVIRVPYGGRVRLERWGSRTLDIDIITYGTLIKAGKRLELPHPRAYQRAFVLVPWALMNPDAVLPGHGSVATLAKTVESEVWVIA